MRLIKLLIQRNTRVYSIKKYDGSYSAGDIQSIIKRLNEIDRQIQFANKSIVEAQLVRFRSLFFKSNNILDGFQKRIVETSADKSVQWHLKELFELRGERRKLQLNYDRLTGKAWQRKLIKLIQLISIGLILLIAISFIILGLFAALYLLPVFLMLILGFLILQKIK